MSKLKIGDKVTYASRNIVGTIASYMSGYYRVEHATGWIDVRADVEELKLIEWTTLAELRPGAIFETEDGERGVKVQPLRLGQPVYWASLATGRLLGLALEEAETLKVREIQIP